jgi:hypothetical protein
MTKFNVDAQNIIWKCDYDNVISNMTKNDYVNDIDNVVITLLYDD